MTNEVSESLKKAYDAVTAAGIPEHLHEVAFREAMRVLVPTNQPVVAATPSAPVVAGRTSTSGAGADEAPAIPEDVMYERVATQTGADRSKVEQLVHMDNGVPVVTLPGLRLGRNNAEKTRTVAQVLTIVRGFGLGEADTSIEVVRNEVIRLKCYDSANFTAHLGSLDGYVITGSGQGRRIRAKANGIQSFPGLVDRLFGEA